MREILEIQHIPPRRRYRGKKGTVGIGQGMENVLTVRIALSSMSHLVAGHLLAADHRPTAGTPLGPEVGRAHHRRGGGISHQDVRREALLRGAGRNHLVAGTGSFARNQDHPLRSRELIQRVQRLHRRHRKRRIKEKHLA